MIFVLETMMPGERHLMVNSSLVKILSSRDQVCYWGDKVQARKIEQSIESSDYSWRKIRVQGNPKLFLLPFIMIYHLFIFTFLLMKLKKGDVLVISCVFPVTHYLIKQIKKLFRKKKLIITLHGELEYIVSPYNRLIKILGTMLRSALSVKTDAATCYLVYGDFIKKNIIDRNWLKEEKILAINHPYDYNLYEKHIFKEGKRETWHVGIIGNASTNKNAQYIFELAESMGGAIKEGKINFHVIGALQQDMVPFLNDYVHYRNNNVFISRQEFESEVSNLDYVLFFYDKTQYNFTASGAFFDCVKFQTPVLTFKNAFFNYYFETFGNIGKQFDTLDQMKAYLTGVIHSSPVSELLRQREAVAHLRDQLSIESIQRDFWSKYDAFYRKTGNELP